MSAFMQILKVGDVREGIKDGRPWKMQEAQAMLLDESGEVVEVGVYRMRRDEVGVMTVGIYAPRFSLGVGRGDKNKGDVIGQVTGWTPVARNAKGFAPADEAVAAVVAKAGAK